MSELNKWINNTGGAWKSTSSMNSKLVLTKSQANYLALATYNISMGSLIFGDYTKWCQSLVFYPIKINQNTDTEYSINAGGVDYPEAKCIGLIEVNPEYGYTLGEWKHPGADNFMKFEPYTKYECYLPYYGMVDLKVNDINNKYVQFRLYVDYNTGQAQYLIGVNNNSVISPNAPYVLGTDDANTRIIGSYNFQLGVSIPISSSNLNENIRNILLGGLKGVASIGSSIIGEKMPSSRTIMTDTTKRTKRNPKTGRQITESKKTREKESVNYTYDMGGRINTAINTSFSAIENMNLHPTIGMSNNTSLSDSGSLNIVIVKREVKTTLNTTPFNDTNYKHIYGLPLGEMGTLNNRTGFVSVSDIILQGDGFKEATQQELLMIDNLLKNGVYM